MKVALRDDGPTGGTGINPARVFLLPIVYEVAEKSFLVGAAGLIAISEHAKRRVIAIGF